MWNGIYDLHKKNLWVLDQIAEKKALVQCHTGQPPNKYEADQNKPTMRVSEVS